MSGNIFQNVTDEDISFIIVELADVYATIKYVDDAVASLHFDYFLTDTASDIGTYYHMQDVDTGEAESSLTKAGLAGGDDQLLFSYATPLGYVLPEKLSIGTYSGHFGLERSAGTRVVEIYWKLFKRAAGGAETELMQSELSGAITIKSPETIYARLNTEKTLASDDRLVLKVYANVDTVGTSADVKIYQEGTVNSAVTIRVSSDTIADLYLKKSGLAGGQTAFGGIGANEDLIFGSTSNATKGNIIIISGETLKVDTINETAANAGVNIEDVIIKDGSVILDFFPAQLYFGEAASAPAGWYHLNSSAGTNVVDSSGFGIDLSTVNMVDGDWVPGLINNCLQFAATKYAIAALGTDFSFDNTDAFSIEFWVDNTDTTAQIILSKMSQSAPNRGFQIVQNATTGKINVSLRNDVASNQISVDGNIGIAGGGWHYGVVTYDGSSTAAGVKIYVDTVLNTNTVLADTLSATTITATKFQLSGRDTTNLNYKGKIDEWAIHNGVIDQTYINARFNAGAGTESIPGFTNRGILNVNAATGEMSQTYGGNCKITTTGGGTEILLIPPSDGFVRVADGDMSIANDLIVGKEAIFNDDAGANNFRIKKNGGGADAFFYNAVSGLINIDSSLDFFAAKFRATSITEAALNSGLNIEGLHYENDYINKSGSDNTGLTFDGSDNGTFTQNLNVNGKLTVTGIIDPTALILDPQASAPSTDDGAIYYDSGDTEFKFRENGAWKSFTSYDTFLELTDTPASYNAGRILFEGAAAVEDDINLFWDNTLKRLGIGQITPLVELHVGPGFTGNGNINLARTTLSDEACIRLRTLNSYKWLFGMDDTTGDDFVIYDYEKGTGEFVFLIETGTGHVGFGTDSPLTKLSIFETGTLKANTDILSITNEANSTNMADTKTSIRFDQTYYDVTTPASIPAGRITIGADGNWTSALSTHYAYMLFETTVNGVMTEHARFNSVGNFAIGISAFSSYKLHVAGNLKIDHSGATETAIFKNADDDLDIDFDCGAAKSTIMRFLRAGVPKNSFVVDSAGSMIFNSEFTSNMLVMKSSGAIGMAVTDPVEKLEVGGNIKLSGYIGLDTNNNFQHVAANGMLLNSSNNFYINIDSDSTTPAVAYFVVAKDRNGVAGGTELFKIFENGNTALYGKLAIGAGVTAYEFEVTGNSKLNGDLIVTGGITRNITTVNTASYDLLASDDILDVTYTATGTVTIDLKTAQAIRGRTIVVKDAGFNATTNNITITTEGIEKIDNVDTAIINVDDAAITVYCDGTNWKII